MKWSRRSLFGAFIGLVVTPWKKLVACDVIPHPIHNGSLPVVWNDWPHLLDSPTYTAAQFEEAQLMMKGVLEDLKEVGGIYGLESWRITEATRKVNEITDDVIINGEMSKHYRGFYGLD